MKTEAAERALEAEEAVVDGNKDIKDKSDVAEDTEVMSLGEAMAEGNEEIRDKFGCRRRHGIHDELCRG